MTVGEDDADGVGAECLDVGERLRLARVPGVGVIDAAHDEIVAVAFQQAAVVDMEAGREGAGRLSGLLGVRGGRYEGTENDESEEGGQPGK
ncbi:hypothetical protein GCM10010372_08820 [Streptomyces tauricus]|nr:hypothetical protein GCM10010372_08820 [Streptomyces tauricus]